MTQELTLQKEITPIVEQARTLEITTPEEMTQASELLSRLNQYSDRIDEEKEKVTKPLNLALKAERGRWKPLEDMYDSAITVIRGKMSRYQTQAVKVIGNKIDTISTRTGEGRGHFKIETSARKISEIERPQEKVITNSGMIKFRTDKVLKIVDGSLIPLEYYELNESLILKALKAGVIVPGCVLEEIQVPVNYR